MTELQFGVQVETPQTRVSGARGGALAVKRGLTYDARREQAEVAARRGGLTGHVYYCARSWEIRVRVLPQPPSGQLPFTS